MSDSKKDIATAHVSPRDSSMRVKAHAPSHFYGSCLVTVLLGSLHIGGPRMLILGQRRNDTTFAGVTAFAGAIGLALSAMSTLKQHQTPFPHGYQVQTIQCTWPWLWVW